LKPTLWKQCLARPLLSVGSLIALDVLSAYSYPISLSGLHIYREDEGGGFFRNIIPYLPHYHKALFLTSLLWVSKIWCILLTSHLRKLLGPLMMSDLLLTYRYQLRDHIVHGTRAEGMAHT
jgi:hypothetical protein